MSYADPTTGDDSNALQDEASNDVASFSDLAVAGNSTVAPTAPGAPTGLTATADGTTEIDLSWTAPSSDGGAAISGYRIEVSTDAGTTWSNLVADTGSTATTYSQAGFSAGDTRYYRVSAINSAGTGAASNVASASTRPEVPEDWSLIPSGLGPGDTFRVVFLSSTKRNARSTDIADYNTFVQDRAAAGHADIQAYSSGFRAVGCTADTDARDNTQTTNHSNTCPLYGLSEVFRVSSAATGEPAISGPAPTTSVNILLTKTHVGGATGSDYSGIPSNVTFASSQTSRSFSVTATDDSFDDDGERVRISFGTLPTGVTAVSHTVTRVSITDNDEPSVSTDTVPADTSTSAGISVGESWLNGNPVKGRIDTLNDFDWYHTSLTKGRCYQIEFRGKDYTDHGKVRGLTLHDPYIRGVYTSDGTFLPGTENDDGGAWLTALHTLRFNKSGTYYISLTHGWFNGNGTIDLSFIDLGKAPKTCTEIDVDNLTYKPGVHFGK